MISFAFTVDQIRSAPPEVRRWIETAIISALREVATPQPQPAHSSELASCTPDEALALFELVRSDFAAAQVLFEFAREPPLPNSPRPLHAFGIGEFKRKLRLSDDRLADCFGTISQAFTQVRNDAEAVLLGFDASNHVYMHEAAHVSIRSVWERLTGAERPTPAVPPPFDFVPPEIGPAEAVATHQGAPA